MDKTLNLVIPENERIHLENDLIFVILEDKDFIVVFERLSYRVCLDPNREPERRLNTYGELV